VTSVGGTALGIADKSGSYGLETDMGTLRSSLSADGSSWLPLPGSFYFGGGGGTSEDFAQPWYQKSVVPTSLAHTLMTGQKSTTAQRVTPDVAMNGDLYTSVLVGLSESPTRREHGPAIRNGERAVSLEHLGLSPTEEAVYRALIELPAASAAEITEAAPAPPAEVPAALDTLHAGGLIDRTPDGDRYTAAPPALALGAQLAAQRERLQRAELAVGELVEAYRVGGTGRFRQDLAEIVEGPDAVRQRYLQLQLAARHRVDVFATGQARAVGPQNTEESTVRSRSIRARAVIDQAFLSEPGAADGVDSSLAEGVLVRTVEAIPLKLIICDGHTAMLPLGGQGSEVDPSIVLRGGPAHLAQALFDAVWEHARPFRAPYDGIDRLDTHILRLLLAGLTDTAVAGQLDLSARTVQRRLQNLMVRADVTTRIQLGWHARHHGWA
jgi:predicted transcriptional regulator